MIEMARERGELIVGDEPGSVAVSAPGTRAAASARTLR